MAFGEVCLLISPESPSCLVWLNVGVVIGWPVSIGGPGGPRVTQRQRGERYLTVTNAQACSCFSMGPHVEMLLMLYSALRQKTQDSRKGVSGIQDNILLFLRNTRVICLLFFNPHAHFYLFRSSAWLLVFSSAPSGINVHVYLHVWHQILSPQRLKDLEVLQVIAPDPSRAPPISTLVVHEEPICCHHLCLRKNFSSLGADDILIFDRFCQLRKTLIIMHYQEVKLSLVYMLKVMLVKEC